MNSCQGLVTMNINSFKFNDSFIKLRASYHRAFTVREVTVIEKINSEINIFIIYNFSAHRSCFACWNQQGHSIRLHMPETSAGGGALQGLVKAPEVLGFGRFQGGASWT